ncbi:MAG: ParM/StbA family protein [Chloroflexi bacterium]|nr:ParM/StbA family protein [Chloroflexota bacterium]MBU1748186.1 ParM/StbA family protein [Chloroflexota bacterium]
MSSITLAGIDVGFGHTKAVIWRGDEPHIITFPSVLGQAQALDNYQTGIGSQRRRRARTFTYHPTATAAGITYYVGTDALEHSRAQGMRQDRHRIGSDQELILALAALAQADVTAALVVTGVPVIWWEGRRALTRHWIGEHHVTYKGQHRIITIHQVRVVPQPFGGFYSWALDQEGGAALDEADMMKAYALLDVGWNTTDLNGLDGLKPQPRWSGGLRVGARVVSQIIRDEVQRQHDRTLSPHEADRAIKTRQVVAYGDDVDIGPVVDSAIAAVADQVLDTATDLWGSGADFKQVFIFGGGGILLGKHLLTAFPRNGVLLPNPALANAIGFAHFARRPATFKR